MIDLLSQYWGWLAAYWGWLAAIFAVGLLGGLMANDGGAARRRIFVAWAVVAAVVGALFALAGALGAGWVVTGLASLIAFVLGALIGGKGRVRGFWWGPFLVSALIWLCSQYLVGVNAAKLEASHPATISLADKKAAAISAAKALPDSGPLSAGQCQTALAGLIAGENIKFETGSAKVSDASAKLIGAIGAILVRCPSTVAIEVAGFTDTVGDTATNKPLSLHRAEAVVDLLKSGGAPADRLSAVGYGEEKPLAPNDTEEGRAENRRIEFTVK
jgi:outer membrane protein OmpA-like peptidoglycan-associated protein